MAEEDCGATFALPMSEDIEVIPVVIDVTDDAMSAMEGAMASAEDADVLVISVLGCLLYTSPSPRDRQKSRMPSSA